MRTLKDILRRRKNITLAMLTILPAVLPGEAVSGSYLDSAHGSSSAGVSRNCITSLGYSRANCAHCHEQHASSGGVEPNPSGGPSPYALFYDFVDQTDNFCLKCHAESGGVQAGSGIINRSYSYRAGGWNADSMNDIKEAFSFSAPASSHNLDDIITFFTGKWGYTANSNPCAACHNVHVAQGDPLASPNSAKSSATRGWPLSRPSEHASSPWGVWGDDYSGPGIGNGERMKNYTANYQAPFRFSSTTTYEPDGSSTQDGENLTDFNTFCTDCHNASNIIYSTNLTRNLRTIDWNNEKHGLGNADTSLCGDNPYPSGGSGLGKVLSCLDCHEPHGSPNAFLIRKEINGGVLGGTIDSFSTTNWHYLCDSCHQDDNEISASCQNDHYYIAHHSNTGCNADRPYNPVACGGCHAAGAGSDCTSAKPKKVCTDCHFHGSSVGGNPTF